MQIYLSFNTFKPDGPFTENDKNRYSQRQKVGRSNLITFALIIRRDAWHNFFHFFHFFFLTNRWLKILYTRGMQRTVEGTWIVSSVTSNIFQYILSLWSLKAIAAECPIQSPGEEMHDIIRVTAKCAYRLANKHYIVRTLLSLFPVSFCLKKKKKTASSSRKLENV